MKIDDYISYSELPSKLLVSSDDVLLVSSDITRLAFSAIKSEGQFSMSMFIEGLKKKVHSGTLLFPAFTSPQRNNLLFDTRKSLPETGALSLEAFKDESFIRTRDAFHSFLVWGHGAEQLAVANCKSTFGQDSVFSFLHKVKAKMLLIDIDLQHSFTFCHYVEEMERVKYRQYKKYKINRINIDGTKQEHEVLYYEKKPGVRMQLNNLYESFRKEGALIESEINNSVFSIINLEQTVEIIKNRIRSDEKLNLYHFSYLQWVKDWVKVIIS